jgi:hypothetical protein
MEELRSSDNNNRVLLLYLLAEHHNYNSRIKKILFALAVPQCIPQQGSKRIKAVTHDHLYRSS